MTSSFKKSLSFLLKSREFKEWKKNSEDSYLADGFAMLNKGFNENLDNLEWQIDFYSPNKDLMTSFFVKDDIVSIKDEQEILKEKKVVVNELKLDKTMISLKDALDNIKKKYPNEIPDKIIVVLQNIEVPLWNITFLTASFKMLNLNIDAKSGKVIKESIRPVFENFKK